MDQGAFCRKIGFFVFCKYKNLIQITPRISLKSETKENDPPGGGVLLGEVKGWAPPRPRPGMSPCFYCAREECNYPQIGFQSSAVSDCHGLILCGHLGMIDNEDLDRALCRFELQPKLFRERGEDRRTGIGL